MLVELKYSSFIAFPPSCSTQSSVVFDLLLWKIQAADLKAFHNVASTSIKVGLTSKIYGHWAKHGIYWAKDGEA